MQTKLGAVMEIIEQAKGARNTRASLLRLRRALDTLGLSEGQKIQVEQIFEYRRNGPNASTPLYEAFAHLEYPGTKDGLPSSLVKE